MSVWSRLARRYGEDIGQEAVAYALRKEPQSALDLLKLARWAARRLTWNLCRKLARRRTGETDYVLALSPEPSLTHKKGRLVAVCGVCDPQPSPLEAAIDRQEVYRAEEAAQRAGRVALIYCFGDFCARFPELHRALIGSGYPMLCEHRRPGEAPRLPRGRPRKHPDDTARKRAYKARRASR